MGFGQHCRGRTLRGCERGATVERSETGERTMFAPVGQTTARAGQLCWLARGSARPPFNGQLPLMLQAGHARPLPRGCHRLPRRGQDPSLRAIVHGCFVGSGLDRSAGWADVSGLARRGGIHAAREPCAAANTPEGINSSPTHCPQTIFCMAGRRGRRPLPPHFVCAQRKLHLFYYLLSFISYLFIICSIRGMIYLTPISITKRSDPF